MVQAGNHPLSCNQGDWKSALQQKVVQGFSRATCPAQYDMSGATKSGELSEDVRLHEEEKTSENNNAGLLVLGRDGITTGNFVNLSICEQSHRVRHIGERAVTKNHPQPSHACLFVHVFVTTHASA